jgi:hypothetical protein
MVYFAYLEDPLPDPLAPPATPPTPPASSPPAPTAPPNSQAGNAGGATSLVTQPPTPPSTNTPQAPPVAPPVVPPPSSLPTTPPALPFANADAYTVTGHTLTVSAANGLLSNDTNPTGQPMTVSFVNPPDSGSVSVNADGSFTYTNNDPGLTHAVTFSYLATAGGLGSNTATVTLTVGDPPPLVAVDDYYSAGNGWLDLPANGVLANDVAPAGATAGLVGQASHGTATIGADGSVSYVAAAGYTGSDSFTYHIQAGGRTSNVATVYIAYTVIPVPCGAGSRRPPSRRSSRTTAPSTARKAVPSTTRSSPSAPARSATPPSNCPPA